MRPKFVLLFIFFTLLFLFYPGESVIFNIFAFNKSVFDQTDSPIDITVNDIPSVKTTVQPFLTAEGAYVVDLPTFTPIFTKNAHQKLYPASTTKIITALVAYDVYKPDDIITIKKPLQDGQLMGLVEGERITVENLLYGMLVYSGNDAAYAFAQDYGFDKFVQLMNFKAKQLGMKDSAFKNPAGLDDFFQYTTPYDLTLASRELLKNKYLRKIVATKEITISDVDFQYFHKLDNVNKLLGEVQGIGGLKTGYTENAGENLVSLYKKHGHEYVVVILKSADRFEDTRSMVKWLDESVIYTPVHVNGI